MVGANAGGLRGQLIFLLIALEEENDSSEEENERRSHCLVNCL